MTSAKLVATHFFLFDELPSVYFVVLVWQDEFKNLFVTHNQRLESKRGSTEWQARGNTVEEIVEDARSNLHNDIVILIGEINTSDPEKLKKHLKIRDEEPNLR